MPSVTLYIEFPVTVSYDLQPYEAPTRDYPGCPAGLEITSITAFNDLDITTRLSTHQLQALEDQLFLHLEESQSLEDERRATALFEAMRDADLEPISMNDLDLP